MSPCRHCAGVLARSNARKVGSNELSSGFQPPRLLRPRTGALRTVVVKMRPSGRRRRAGSILAKVICEICWNFWRLSSRTAVIHCTWHEKGGQQIHEKDGGALGHVEAGLATAADGK